VASSRTMDPPFAGKFVFTVEGLTIGAFTVTPFGAVNLQGAVATYTEDDPGAPADVSAAAREIRYSMTPEDRATVFTSHDPDALCLVFTKYSALMAHRGE